MNSTGLLKHFRSQVKDEARPYLWSDEEAWLYMNDAYRMFVRLTGGIDDFTSDACFVDIAAGQATSPLSKVLLRVMRAQRRSDGTKIEVINFTDIGTARVMDYGQPLPLKLDNRQGQVTHMVMGMQRHIARWVMVPEADDVAELIIKRLPLDSITGPGQEFSEIDEDHVLPLLHWMKHLAYNKQDSETFDKGKSLEFEAAFRAYCDFAKAEMERYKHKTRVVGYGGI